jgi:S1-C subfamily serine protease
MFRSLLLLCLFFSLNAKAAQDASWSGILQKVSDSVVTIRVDAARAFDTAASSTTQATGFVVDTEQGLILTNRHVVQSGPVIAEALFSNREEVELIPVYRDPVHDFGFFKYNPADLRFHKPAALKLAPEKARVGREIRVIGNDAGEQLSILAGTLARLDRGAPYYGRGRYNDFNTFYYQSASGVSGGSSGSPVVDRNGNVLALNAGGSRNAASSFFLPLDRVKRALALIQQNKPVTRGTLQTTLVYKPYDEVRRLGLTPDTEAELRKVNHGVGLLVVQHVLPEGPADGVLMSGDIILKGGGKHKPQRWLRRFDEFEALLDSQVKQVIELLVERRGQPVTLELAVGDLHAITPDRYLSFGEAIVHDLSYQQARHLNQPLRGVYVAQPGYVLSTAGVPRGAVILELNEQPVDSLDDFEKVLNTLADGEQVIVRFITFQESKRMHVSIMKMDRHWFPLDKCSRDDRQGYWDCVKLGPGPVAEPQRPSKVRFVKYKDPRANRLSSSIVHVQFDIPYHIDGIQEAHYGGAGLVIDAQQGLVLVDRNTVPVAMGDVRIVFAGAVDVPARVVFIHPLHNMAIVQYDPELLEHTEVTAATLKSRPLEAGDDVWLVGIKADQSLLVEKMSIASIDALEFSIPQVPAFRESNLDAISLNNAPFTQGGVLTDKRGDVLALWSSFSFGDGKEFKQFEWGVPIDLVEDLVSQWECCRSFRIYSLETELATLSIAQASKLGMPDSWLERFQDADGHRQVLAVSRRVAGSDAFDKLQEGDLLVAVAGELVRTFRDVEKRSQQGEVQLTLLRAGEEINLSVKTRELDGTGTNHIVQWAGALVQNPHRPLAVQRGIEPQGVYVSFVWWGSPASRYRLSAVSRITELDGVPIKDLDHFIERVKSSADRESITLKVVDLIDRESLLTLKQDNRYWPAREVLRDNGAWQSREL